MPQDSNFDFHQIDVSSAQERDELHQFLIDCTDSFRYSRGWHVPDNVVDTIIRKKFISPDVIERFKEFWIRFALRVNGVLLWSVLVANKIDQLFIIDADTMRVPLSEHPDYSPPGYHNVINYLVHPDSRGRWVGRGLVQGLHNNRHLFQGKGISYRSEPPSFPAYLKMWGVHLPEYDKFSSHPDSPIPPGFLSNKDFNDRYVPEATKLHPDHRDKIDTHRYKYALLVNNTVFSDYE